jgi:four helix bundle protein
LSTGEFLQFLGIARGSTLEVQTQLEAAKMLKFGRSSDLEIADKTAAEIVLILNAAIRTCRTRIAAGKQKKGIENKA